MDKTKSLKSTSVKEFRFKLGDLSKHLNVKNKQTAEIRGRAIVCSQTDIWFHNC